MTLDDLKERYGKSAKRRQLYNRAIRAELPGGSACLDSIELLDNVRVRKLDEDDREAAEIAGLGVTALHSIRDEMVVEIKRRYGMEDRDGKA